MSRDNKNLVLYGLAGAGALLLSGAAIYYMSRVNDPFVKEVHALGDLKVAMQMGGQDVLDFDYFNNLIKLIKKTH